MRYQQVFVLGALTSLVSGRPKIIMGAPRSDVHQYGKRDWINDQGGNLHISFSDTTIQIGDIPTGDIMSSLMTACSDEGICDTSDRTVDGTLTSGGLGGSANDITVTLTPSGAYPSWIHNGLGDALSAAIAAAATCEDTSVTPTCPNPAAYCPAQPYTVHQCTVPQFWGIDYQDSSVPNAAPPNIGVHMTVAVDTGSGMCATFATIGSAVAGAVNGAAGGIFTLIGLLCAV